MTNERLRSASPRSPHVLLAAALLVGAVIVAYLNGLNAPFVFDDIGSIVENPSIRRLASAEILAPPSGLTVSGRPLVNASLALNYAASETSVRGYRLTNIAIHAFAAVVLFGLLRRTFLRPRLRDRFGDDAAWWAFAAALVWALHPLQTESVTYVIQRAESLMGLWYLLTLYSFARSADSPRATAWRGVALVACGAGMATKEVMVSAPLAVLLYDRVFVASSWRELWRDRGRFHLLLALTWLVLALLVWRTGDRAGTAGLRTGIAVSEYALTQGQAIVHYLRLAVWPHPLVFDYGPYRPPDLRTAILATLLLLFLLGSAAYFFRRRPAAAFASMLFVFALAPTSSVIPIATQPMAEHRMYLPLAALTALAAAGLHRIGGRRAGWMLIVVAIGFGVLTVRRNDVYRSERALWEDTVQTVPANHRARSSLGWAFLAEQNRTQAEASFRAALDFKSEFLDARHGLARVLEEQGRLQEAAEQYHEILRSHPADFIAHHALGHVRFQLGDLRGAAQHFQNAVSAQPDSAPAHNNLGSVYFELRQFAVARRHQETALRLDPLYPEAHYNLGNVLAAELRPQEACASYEHALRLRPDYLEAHVNLAAVLQSLGQNERAIHHYREALRLQPDFAFAQRNLQLLLGPSRQH